MSPKEVSEKSPALIMRRHVGCFFLAKADKTLCPISSHILISWIVLSSEQIWTSVCIETWKWCYKLVQLARLTSTKRASFSQTHVRFRTGSIKQITSSNSRRC